MKNYEAVSIGEICRMTLGENRLLCRLLLIHGKKIKLINHFDSQNFNFFLIY
jgi:hypothetical protein